MNDDLDVQLARLPQPMIDDRANARALEAAHQALERARASAIERWIVRLERGYGRLEPLLALLVAVIDVRWAASVVS